LGAGSALFKILRFAFNQKVPAQLFDLSQWSNSIIGLWKLLNV